MPTQSPSAPKPQKYPNNIRKAIKLSPWKLYEVAEKTLIPKETLIDYCAGKYPVPHERRDALAEVLQCLPEYLIPPLPNVRQAYESQNSHEETKDLQALLVLRTHCETHPTDENALQQLMELLGKVGRYTEIEKCYERFVKAVKKVDFWRKPDAETTELLARLRAECARSTSSPAPEHVGQASQTQEATAKDPHTDAQASSALSGCDEPLPISQSSATHGQRIGETVFLTIALSSAEFQALALASPSGLSTPVAPLTPQTTSAPSLQPLTNPPFQSVSRQGIILRGAGANAPSLDDKNLRDCSLGSSTDIVPALKVYSTRCQGELTTSRQQRDIYETIEQWRTMNDEHIRDLSHITRRDLLTLASVSSSLLLNMRRGWSPAGILEELLSEVTASVTTCWYLLQGSDGLPVVEWAVPQYLPELVEIVKHSSLHRQRAAYLAAQGFLLRGLVAHHRTRFAERVAHCQQAVTYAHVSGDLTLLLTCQAHLSNAFLINGQPEESLDTHLQAEADSKSPQLSGFLRSKVLGELSHPYARQGNDQEVARCLGEAYATFTDADSETPVFLSTDYGRYQIILFEGLSTLDLGNHVQDQGRLGIARKYWKDAAEKFGKMERLPSGLDVPMRIAAEALIAQALAFAKAGNMEGFLTAFTKGAQLVKELGSEKRKQEAREALNAALEQWPNDLRITGLWELLI